MLLNILLLAIFFSSLLVYFISPNQIKKFSLTMSIFFFLLSLSIFFNFDTLSGFQYVTSFKFIPFFGITFTIGVDSLSLFFIILTSFIMPLTILST
jgi:NADH-quinone oxidoreductase subunit M